MIRICLLRSIIYDLSRRLRWVGLAFCLTFFTTVSPTLSSAQDTLCGGHCASSNIVTSEQQNWGQRNSHLLGPLAIIFSAFGAWSLAYLSIRQNRAISQKRATFDYLYQLNWDKDYIHERKIFMGLTRGRNNLSKIAQDYDTLKKPNHVKSDADDEIVSNHNAIRTILNEYEAIAVGISTGTLSEEIILRNMRQNFAKTIDTCNDFIEETRRLSELKEPDALYCEVKKLTTKWRRMGKLQRNEN